MKPTKEIFGTRETIAKKTNKYFKIKNMSKKSNCCDAPVIVGGEGTTHYYVCAECNEPCDLAVQNKDEKEYLEAQIKMEEGRIIHHQNIMFDRVMKCRKNIGSLKTRLSNIK